MQRALVYRLASHPLFMVAALAYVGVNAWVQPGQGFGRTTVGRFCSQVLRDEARSTTCIIPYIYRAVRESDGTWTVLGDLDDPKWSMTGKYRVTVTNSEWENGFWSPVVRTTGRRVAFGRMDGTADSLSTEEHARLLDAINALNPGEFPADSRASDLMGGRATKDILWKGVANNASVATALGAAVPGLIALARSWRRPKPGHCAKCGYVLAGLPSSRCPECGATAD